MRTVAIIQARMGSSRLPGKVLMPLAGKPVLWHIIHRLRKCRLVDEIAIATSDNSSDDPVRDFAATEGIEVVRGPEDNVLERYMLAARQLSAEVIVRVTGDAPLVDPAVIDYLIDTLVREQADFCMGYPGVPCIHEGFDPFTFHALQRLVDEAGENPVAREHVTAYFKLHPEFVSITRVPIDPDHQFSGARVSVDTPADLRFLEEVYARLNVPAGEADMCDVVRLLRTDPELLKINAHVHQKDANERSRRILFRCDGNAEIGLGHVVRCLALADEMREAHGCGVSFAMASGPVGFELVRKAGYPIIQKAGEHEDVWLDVVIQDLRPDALVLDVRSGLSRGSVEKWRSSGVMIVTVDDPSERRLAADLALYPPVPQVQKMDWTGFNGQLHVGWEWVALRRGVAQRPPHVPHERPLVLVTMGGSDPAGLTLKAVEGLDLLDQEFDTVVVLGSGFCHVAELAALLKRTRRKFDVRRNVQDMPGLMSRSDLAVASFGVTAYELAAMGVPAVYMCLTEDHAVSASSFVNAGIGVSLGVYREVKSEFLAHSVLSMLVNDKLLAQMSELASNLVDGRGTGRIVNRIVEEI
ncbi:MAG: cytidylyltransferase domain-containing protein [Eubacteriales bacterium]